MASVERAAALQLRSRASRPWPLLRCEWWPSGRQPTRSTGGKNSENCESARLQHKAKKGAASLACDLSRAIPEPPLRRLGKHSAVSAFERDGRAVTIADLTPGSIFDKDLSGKIVVDSGIVYKIFGVVEVWLVQAQPQVGGLLQRRRARSAARA